MTTKKTHSSITSFWVSFFAFALTLFHTRSMHAQSPGHLDTSFETGSRFSGSAYVIAPAVDDKLYVGGSFTTVIGALRNRIARLNADGTADTSFNPGSGANDVVHTIAVQTDGKVLIGGRFTSYNGIARNRIARINADGSLDTTFNPGTGADNWVYSAVLQADGKVVIGGIFTNFNDTTRNRITRLNADGSLDTTFNSGTGASDAIRSVVVQADGKFIIGGNFGGYNGNSRGRVARLNVDGSFDSSFLSVSGANLEVYSVALQADGKVMIGGLFSSFGGTARRGIARLNANGTLDTSFNPGTGTTLTGSSARVESVAMQGDGKVVIGGVFETYNDTVSRFLTRINSNGSIDTSFNLGSGVNGQLSSVALQSDGKVLISGLFGRFNGTSRFGIARLNTDGSLDPNFNSHSGVSSSVLAIGSQPDGKLLIGGRFGDYAGTARNGVARLNEDGSLDASYSPDIGANNVAPVASLAVLRDGKMFIGGTSSGGPITRSHIARINLDGTTDTSFNPGTGANSEVGALAMQVDGKVLIGGKFTSYTGVIRNGIARLNTDGSLDLNFMTGSGVTSSGGSSGTVSAIALQTDNKVIIGGSFTLYNGTARRHIARLNPDGSLDTSFNTGTGPSGSVNTVVLQADGKVLIGGWFISINGTARNRIARLNQDGSLDSSFNPGNGTDAEVNSIALQADGKVLTCGNFTSYNGIQRSRIVRLNSDGSLDTNFDPGAGASAQIWDVILAADGKVLIGGDFLGYDGVARSFLARVFNDPASESLSVDSATRIEWLRGGSAPEVAQVTFEYSSDGMIWTSLGSGNRMSGGWELTGLDLPTSGQFRARGRTGNNHSSSVIEHAISYPLASLPSVTAAPVSEISINSASGGGEVSSDGGATVTERGLVYATTTDPTLATGTKVISGDGLGSFTTNLSSLAPSTTYYVRAYATNSAGTGYSSSVFFSTHVASSSAKLTDLAWGAPLSPSFDSDVLSYKSLAPFGFDETTLWSMMPVTEDPNATVTINGQPASEPFLLSNPSNTLFIVVTAQDGVTTRTYTLVVRRPTSYLVPGTNITLSYTVNGSSASIVGCNFEAVGALVIPPQLGGHNVTAIHPQAFQNIFGLTGVTIPNGVVSVGDRSFEGATGLTSITLPDSVISVGENAFAGCSGLTNVHIGAGLATIGKDAFFACENLTSFTVSAANPNYASSGGALFNKSMTTLIEFPEGYTGAFIVPEGVSVILENSFFNCDGLTAVTLPTSLMTLESSAFYRCTGLTSLSIPSGATNIGSRGFFGCSGLTQIIIGSGVTTIGAAAFGACSSLTSATFLGNAPTLQNNSVFFANAVGFTIYYQAAATGFTTPTWNGYPAFPLATAQTISFPQIPNQLVSASPIALNATASSGLPVTIEVISGLATLTTEVLEGLVVGYSLTLTGPGAVTLRASQAGNATFAPATPVDVSFNVAPSSNAELASLTLSSGTLTPTFISSTLSYTAGVMYETASVTVTPMLADPNATITVNGSNTATPVALNVGANVVTILVTAQDTTTTKIYTVTIAREEPSDIVIAREAMTSAMASAGLTGEDAVPSASPFNDGVENLLKYAFNMNLAGPDVSILISGSGNSGLPVSGLVGEGATTAIRVEFLRRKGSGLVYTPMRSSTLTTGSFVAMTGTPVVTSIDEHWERVTVDELVDMATNPKSFAIVEVVLP